jgi:cobalamin biosynthesis protein CbiD
LIRNMSCDIHLLNELLEADDTIVVLTGKLWKLWDSVIKLHSSLCELRLENTVLSKVPTKCTQFYINVLI